ncbi:SpaN/EivJ family type III secretion system needle length determinant [Dyella sp. Tek66A03]|uniref:SpaN/EivJ family type III secretion system needle length determinant n=1 Tax=Dyella sp. Tek66A03 TaxID=3458298 RepID=UPI00403E9E1C
MPTVPLAQRVQDHMLHDSLREKPRGTERRRGSHTQDLAPQLASSQYTPRDAGARLSLGFAADNALLAKGGPSKIKPSYESPSGHAPVPSRLPGVGNAVTADVPVSANGTDMVRNHAEVRISTTTLPQDRTVDAFEQSKPQDMAGQVATSMGTPAQAATKREGNVSLESASQSSSAQIKDVRAISATTRHYQRDTKQITPSSRFVGQASRSGADSAHLALHDRVAQNNTVTRARQAAKANLAEAKTAQTEVTYRFLSWGGGQSVKAFLTPQNVVFSPSTERVGTALATSAKSGQAGGDKQWIVERAKTTGDEDNPRKRGRNQS